MVSERLRTFAREYGSRPHVARVAPDAQPMGNTSDRGKVQSIQSVADGVANVAHVARENDNGGGNGDSSAERDLGARLLLMLWPLGATVAADPDGALTITPHGSGKRIPPVLLAACRRHREALAAWVGGGISR